MSSPTDAPGRIQDPLYNSRVVKNYLEYIKRFHPDLELDDILGYAWIKRYEVEDQGHWFTQWQMDRFHARLMQKTGDSKLPRKVGQFAASSQAAGALKNYILGFMTPAAAYWLVEKIAPHMTRAMSFKSRKLGSYKFEITAIPKPGVILQPYQCENMMGQIEALSKLFTGKFPRVDHDECMHKGGEVCRYLITIDKTPTLIWRSLRLILLLPSLALFVALHFIMPSLSWTALTLLFVSAFLGASYYFEHLERDELSKNMASQQEAVKALLDQIGIRYNETQLIKEFGQAASMFLDVDRLLAAAINSIKSWLDFDRGGIWLANKDRTRLIYKVGFGYNRELEEILKKTDFHLDRPLSRGVAIQAFRKQQPFLVNDIEEIERDLSTRSLEFMRKLGTHSFICVPIVYERESLGVLFVDNIQSKRDLSQSDMSLLSGVAIQIGVSIHNAASYQKLQEGKKREQNLRRLFEKYVPSPVIMRYLNSGETDLFRGEESFVTALFVDIRGFTSSSESMEAKDVVCFLNNYYEKCSSIVSLHGGHINKYMGDGFLALFGAPEPLRDHTRLAFDAACQILDMSRSFILEGNPMMIGIGLHSGRVIVGNIGCRTKIEYTAIGDTVNTAARLQEFTKFYSNFPIIMSRSVWEGLAEHPLHPRIINLGAQKMRGKREKFESYGFNPMIGRTPLGDSARVGVIPLQRMKGA